MSKLNWQLFGMQTLLFLIAILFIFFLLKEYRMIRFQKRFEKFALTSIHEKEKSIGDILLQKLWFIIQKITLILKKSEALKQYSKKYEKYISYEEKDQKSSMDYIALKFLLAFSFLLLNIVMIILEQNHLEWIICLISFFIGFYIPDLYLSITWKQKRKRIEEDLLKAIIIMNNCFKSGRTIMQAIEFVKEELDGPIRDEFKKIYMDMTYGLNIETVFQRFYDRVNLEDAKYITSSLTLLNKTGGNIINVFASIEKTIFDKKKLMNEMKSITSASVFVFRLLTLLPILFASIILILNKNYFSPFFKTPFGFLTFLLIILLYILYIFIMKQIMKVKM